MTHVRTALVIGGGIAGPAAAIALQKAGIDAAVYEARSYGADEAGAFLTLAANGIDALRVIGADRAALATGFATPAITLRSGAGKRLGQSPTGPSLPDGTASRTIRRAALYRGLTEEALARGVRIEHGKRLVEAHEDGDRVRAVFADRSEAAGDVLIGCDGVHSTVRGIIDRAAPAPTYAGLLGTGGYARGVPGEGEPGSYEMIFGRRAFFGYAVAPGGEVWWFANLPRRPEPARPELEAVAGDELRRRLLETFRDDAGPAIGLIAASPEIVPLTPIHSIPHLPLWHRGRMIVIGDAAHAPSPTSGQGASLSIEDAVVLARCLRDEPRAQAAFARFEAARRPRVERIIKWAARINNGKAAGPVARRLRDAALPAILRLTAGGPGQQRMLDYRIEWEAPVAAPA